MSGLRVDKVMRAPELTFDRARKLRRDMTLPEVLLWDCLRGGRLHGLRFRRQHPAGPYVLDFFCAAAKLAVEVDGGHHDLPGQMVHDGRRDAWLRKQGIRTLRFPATDILNKHMFEGVLVTIAESGSTNTIKPSSVRMPPPPPSAVPFPRERGRISGGTSKSSLAKRGRWPEGPEGAHPFPAERRRGTAEGGGGRSEIPDMQERKS